YPNYGTITRSESGNNSVFQSLQWNLEKRFSHGFSILTNYTWSKTLDSQYVANPFNPRRERGIQGDDIPHNFKFSNVWDVPRSRRTGAAGKLLNGWQLNSILIWQSGFPFSVSSGRDNSFTGGTDRTDFIGSGSAQLANDRPHGDMILKFF